MTWLFVTLYTTPTNAQEVRVLVVAGQNNHDWKRSTPYLLWIVDSHAGISGTIDNAPSSGGDDAWEQWNPNFAAYDVVVLNYNGQMWPGLHQGAFRSLHPRWWDGDADSCSESHCSVASIR